MVSENPFVRSPFKTGRYGNFRFCRPFLPPIANRLKGIFVIYFQENIMQDELPQVTIYCDGAAVPNPGVGGYGVVLIHGAHIKELRGSVDHASNNAMEITAAIEGLNALNRPCAVTLISDSQYLINTMSAGWSRNKNVELWQLLDRAARTHKVTWQWVRGHTGDKHNERAHDLANQAIREVTHSC